jgi:hypothetical protein
MKIKVNNEIHNITDIYGKKHKNAVVLRIMKNVLIIRDLDTKEARVVRKEQVGLKPAGRDMKLFIGTHAGFDLAACMRKGEPSSFDKVRHFVSGKR